MPVVNDLWSGAVYPRPAPPPYVPVAVVTRSTPPYVGAFRDRHSRFDLRCSRRYGYSGYIGYVYETPLVVLWADDYDHCGGTADVWEL